MKYFTIREFFKDKTDSQYTCLGNAMKYLTTYYGKGIGKSKVENGHYVHTYAEQLLAVVNIVEEVLGPNM